MCLYYASTFLREYVVVIICACIECEWTQSRQNTVWCPMSEFNQPYHKRKPVKWVYELLPVRRTSPWPSCPPTFPSRGEFICKVQVSVVTHSHCLLGSLMWTDHGRQVLWFQTLSSKYVRTCIFSLCSIFITSFSVTLYCHKQLLFCIIANVATETTPRNPSVWSCNIQVAVLIIFPLMQLKQCIKNVDWSHWKNSTLYSDFPGKPLTLWAKQGTLYKESRGVPLDYNGLNICFKSHN